MPVGLEPVDDLDRPVAVAVRVPDRVRARLGDGELEVGQRLLRERPHAREPGEREPGQRDELRLRRDAQPDRPYVPASLIVATAQKLVVSH